MPRGEEPRGNHEMVKGGVREAAARMLLNFTKILASMMEARPEGFASRN